MPMMTNKDAQNTNARMAMFTFVRILLLGISIIYYSLTDGRKQDTNDEELEKYIAESTYTVTGTITKVNTGNLSKKRGKEHLHLYLDLHLKPHDAPNEELKFHRYPAAQADMQLQVGQNVSIRAWKKRDHLEDGWEESEYIKIYSIEPL
jgi:hypothetical protein